MTQQHKYTGRFKIGDRVNILSCRDRKCDFIYVGQIGTVKEVWPNNQYGEYGVYIEGGASECFFEDMLSPVLTSKKPKNMLAIKTKVRVIRCERFPEYVGKIGRVRKALVTTEGISIYKIQCGKEWLKAWAEEDCLEVLTPAE